MSNELDFKDVRDTVAEALREELGDLVEGASDDVRVFAFDIATAIVASKARPNAALDREHLDAQLRALAAINRIRVVDAQWDLVSKVTNVARAVALGLLGKLGGLI